MDKYTDEILNTAKELYRKGMRVKSPMTGKEFTVDNVLGAWHRHWIEGFSGKFFFDVVWYNGKWAEILT